MIFKKFESGDIVSGRSTKVSSGFWPNGNTYWSSSFLESNFFDLTNAQTPAVAYGSSPYDVRKTMYYIDVYPDLTRKTVDHDPYFSITYGHIAGNMGSGSFKYELDNIKAYPTKAIYNQYKNLLLGGSDLDGKFTMKSGSTELSADDIFVINFSSYKTKDRIDEGVFQLSLRGFDGTVITLIDDSHYVGKVQSVYQIVTGSINNVPTTAKYQGFGLFYPNDGIAIFNASVLNEVLGYKNFFSPTNIPSITISDGNIQSQPPSASYYTGSKSELVTTGEVLLSSSPKWNSTLNVDYGNQSNLMAFFWSLKYSNSPIVVRKSEYVPSRQYYVRVKNRDFNYSNNPTYVHDGSDGIHSKGTIRNEEFFTDPKTYITTIGLYNDSNELVAVAKLSRPTQKTFDNEFLCKIRLDF